MSARLRSAATWVLILVAGVLAGAASLLGGVIVMAVFAAMAVLLGRTNGAFGLGAFLTGVGMTWLVLLGPRAEGSGTGSVTSILALIGGFLTAGGAILTVLGRRSGGPPPGPSATA